MLDVPSMEGLGVAAMRTHDWGDQHRSHNKDNAKRDDQPQV